MPTSLSPEVVDSFTARMARTQRDHIARYPGESGARQPVHTVYGGAHLFTATTAAKLGARALAALDEHAPDAAALAAAMGLDIAEHLADAIYARVRDKLSREPVEDVRIDFEDGFGVRPDAEEDEHAERTARDLAVAMTSGAAPPFSGIRIKPLSDELGARSVRTLDLFVSTLAAETGGALPDHFVVTLPKITTPDQVALLVELFEHLEAALPLADGALRLELMIETTQSILTPTGDCALPRLADAARGRCVAAHFGTYDYTAACDITAAHQHMLHPACDFARAAMQVAYAGTGLWLSDGATNILPVGDRTAVHAAWRLHAEHVRHSLERGYYQGWDLHPAQLPTRYGAVYAFFLEALPAASERLANFIDKAARATLAGDVFDDAATGQGLLNFFLRGLGCGAITEADALATGITVDELRGRSFAAILANRR